MWETLVIQKQRQHVQSGNRERRKIPRFCAEGNICIALAYFPTTSHPSACSPFNLFLCAPHPGCVCCCLRRSCPVRLPQHDVDVKSVGTLSGESTAEGGAAFIYLSNQTSTADSPKSSDSNKQVSPTPTCRHQARKLAVLSRAKKEPEGAVRRHGILWHGRVCERQVRAVIGEQTNRKLISRTEITLSLSTPISGPSAVTLVSTQDQGPFYTRINIWDGGLQKKRGATSPGPPWFGIKYHTYGFQPPHGLFGEIYAPCCGFIQDMCVCATRKVQWAHAGNMQAFVGIFLFFPGTPLALFWDHFCCWTTLHSWRNNVGHISSGH